MLAKLAGSNRGRSRNIALVCVSLFAIAACSHSGKSGKPSPSTSTIPSATHSASSARSTRLLTVGSTNVQRVGSRGVLDPTTRRGVVATAQRYVNDAILAPLEIGRLSRDYPAIFAPGIRPAATGADRATLTDAAVGRTTTLTEASAPLALTALADPSGALVYVAANFEVTVQATKATGTIGIDRHVELTMQRIGATWFVVAYRVTVKRTAPRPRG